MSRKVISDQTYREWTERSRITLKQKITHNYNKRREKAMDLITQFLLESVPNSDINVNKFNIFHTDRIIQQFHKKVDEWPGVDLNAVQEKKKKLSEWTWDDYQQRADNWWNRYKAKWIGDYLFYPLFNTLIDQFIKGNGCKTCARSAGSNTTNYSHELLKVMLMKEVMKVPEMNGWSKTKYEVKFDRSRGQPLILHQSYIKAEQLMELFREIGDKYGVPYNIRAEKENSKEAGKRRVKAAHKWIDQIIEKLSTMGNIENIVWGKCNHNDDQKEDEHSIASETSVSEISSTYARARDYFLNNNYQQQSEPFKFSFTTDSINSINANQDLLESPNYSFSSNYHYTPPLTYSPSPSSPVSPSTASVSSPTYCICSHPPTRCDKCGGLCHPMFQHKKKPNPNQNQMPRRDRAPAPYIKKQYQPNYKPVSLPPSVVYQQAPPEPVRFKSMDRVMVNHDIPMPSPRSDQSSDVTVSQWSINDTYTISSPIHNNTMPPIHYDHDRYTPYNQHHRAPTVPLPVPVRRQKQKYKHAPISIQSPRIKYQPLSPPISPPNTHCYARSTSTQYRDRYQHNYHAKRTVPVHIPPPTEYQIPNMSTNMVNARSPNEFNQFNQFNQQIDNIDNHMPGYIEEDASSFIDTNTSSNMSLPPIGPMLTSFNSQEDNNIPFANMNDINFNNGTLFHS